jgi:hypothetical protein
LSTKAAESKEQNGGTVDEVPRLSPKYRAIVEVPVLTLKYLAAAEVLSHLVTRANEWQKDQRAHWCAIAIIEGSSLKDFENTGSFPGKTFAYR